MFILTPHISNSSPSDAPRGDLRTSGGALSLVFELMMKEEPFFDDKFSHSYKNWGLWDYDVFEAFLTREDSGLPYLEIQVSPRNQNFALVVESPRSKWAYPENKPFESVTQVENGLWTSEVNIPYDNIPGEGAVIKGNLHAIIGRKRSFFSLNPNREERPDFHRPDLFKNLGVIP